MESNDAYTLLEGTILEGKADTFESMMYPEVDVPWIEPLKGYYKEEAWKFFLDHSNSIDPEPWHDFSYGNRSKGLLRWSNYRIGHQIMESFLKENPDVPVQEWTEMSAEDILLKSKYAND